MTNDAPAAEATESEEVAVDEPREARLAMISESLGDMLVDSHIAVGRDIWVRVSTDAWGEVADVVRNRLGLRYFGFLSVIDWMPSPYGRSMDSEVDIVLADAASSDDAAEEAPDTGFTRGVTGGETRFQAFARVSHVGDPGDFWGLTIKADIPDDTLAIDTWTNAYAGADWHEREAWEMFGIRFTGHPGLRNIYLPTDFEGNPMRKDFPLLARMVKPWPGIVDVEPLPATDDGAEEGDQ